MRKLLEKGLQRTEGFRTDEKKRRDFCAFAEDGFWKELVQLGKTEGHGSFWSALGDRGFFERIKNNTPAETFTGQAWKHLELCIGLQPWMHEQKSREETGAQQKEAGKAESRKYAAAAQEAENTGELIAAEEFFSEGGAYLSDARKIKKRNHQLRQACLEEHGAVCKVCGFDFGKTYGEIGEGFIHIHHLHPLAQTSGEHEVDPRTDLVPLCANCHAMAHRRTPEPYSPEELGEMIRKERENEQ